MADRVTLSNFRASFEVANGEIGSDAVLNRAVDQVKQELDNLWNWSTSDSTTTLPSGSLVESLIDDTMSPAIGDANGARVTRSADWLEKHISASSTPPDETYYTWNISRIKNYIATTNMDGGTWN